MGIFWKLKQSRINLLIQIAELARQYHETDCFVEKRAVYSKMFAVRVLLATYSEDDFSAPQHSVNPPPSSPQFLN